MKIKHFAGYGIVNARKISSKTITDYLGDKFTELKIQVRGNHECGLERGTWDTYGIISWLLDKHFMKGIDHNRVVNITTEDRYETLPNGRNEEVCDYTFIIKPISAV